MSLSLFKDPGLIQLPVGEEITTFSSTRTGAVINSLAQKVVDLYEYSSCTPGSKGHITKIDEQTDRVEQTKSLFKWGIQSMNPITTACLITRKCHRSHLQVIFFIIRDTMTLFALVNVTKNLRRFCAGAVYNLQIGMP